MFGRLKDRRRAATRFGPHPDIFLSAPALRQSCYFGYESSSQVALNAQSYPTNILQVACRLITTRLISPADQVICALCGVHLCLTWQIFDICNLCSFDTESREAVRPKRYHPRPNAPTNSWITIPDLIVLPKSRKKNNAKPTP